MSPDNVERLREIYAAINAGLDEPLLHFLHPQFVYKSREELPAGGSYLTTDILRRLAEREEMFRDVRFEAEEFISSDQGVVVAVRGTGVGRVSGAPVDERIFHVWKMEDAKARELWSYSDRAKALAAVAGSQ